ncbi:PAS domain S-box-containing protein [Sulfurivirga caldicuralii]|uniref:PAS domain S-box-containing protein n=1 Tax=Sulfurivirga caldicuralii TaxID=364032 RepID=A0A1N6GBW0_9GAMM|nr:PAS domain-containing protein [Sulfurivirga caldicuralii]SIO04967.1 PAS domain S-box-containing protein [Sulfurivirga caldicuralii]
MSKSSPIAPTGVRHTFDEDVILVSKTDTHGTIKYANPAFCQIAGYSEEELLGQPHNIVRHPDMPRIVFKLLWEHIQSGHEFWGYVKNLSRDGGYYWVFAHVTPTFDTAGTIIGYHSDRRAPKESALAKVEQLYATLRKLEAQGGMAAAEAFLNDMLDKEGSRYDEFVFSL